MYLLFMPTIVVLIPVLVYFSIANHRYKKTTYYQITNNSFLKTHFDKGLLGEYLTYKYLKDLDGSTRFLFNIYLPKDNDETTEIDVVLIHESGIYVFESKNYSGWIFGSEKQRYWTQTLPSGRKSLKNRFFNPIMQNEMHIKWLKAVLQDYTDVIYHSFILFSDRCELKKIELIECKAEVINRYSVFRRVMERARQTGSILNEQQIEEIYARLYPYSQTSVETKQKHVDDILSEDKGKRDSQDIGVETATNIGATNEVENELKGAAKLCVKCGKEMALRTATKGKSKGNRFWGCTGFPKCKNIVNEID